MTEETPCSILHFKDHPALATKMEDCFGLWPFVTLAHFRSEYDPAWLVANNREYLLPAFFYLRDPRALVHYLHVDVEKARLRSTYAALMRAVRRAPDSTGDPA